MLLTGFLLHHSDSRILDRSEDHPDPRADRQSNWFRSFFPAGGFSSGPGGRRDAGDGGLHSTSSHQEGGGVRKISFGPKLRRRGSSVTPEGNKGKEIQGER